MLNPSTAVKVLAYRPPLQSTRIQRAATEDVQNPAIVADAERRDDRPTNHGWRNPEWWEHRNNERR